jgi:Flp pilus assembly protein TadG
MIMRKRLQRTNAARASVSPPTHPRPHFTRMQSEQGVAIVEIALALPLIVLLISVIWQLGLLFNQQITLTYAATVGAQALQADRLSTSGDPCADIFNAIKAAAPTLKSSNIAMTLTMNNNPSVSQTSCSGKQNQLVQGGPVTVQATYPYSFSLVGYTVSSWSGTMSSGSITETEY